MKKLVAIVLVLIVFIIGYNIMFSKGAELLEEGNVASVTVSSLPEKYEYHFVGDDAKAVVDYLSNLNLNKCFTENAGMGNGMIWNVILEYENGNTTTIYHSGNMFIKTEKSTWYRMLYKEASQFETLLEKLDKK